MDSHIAITCTGVTKTFDRMVMPTVMVQDRILRWKKHREKWNIKALDDISFEVQKGEWLGLYGPNGCGKTTLLRILAGLMVPDVGEVKIQGKVCCLFALGTGFHSERSAQENIYFHGLLHGIPAKEVRDATDEIIGFAGVETHRDLPIKCYSTGMRARLAFAAATQIDADVYLLDEVLAVGDIAFQQKCWKFFDDMKAAGKTVVLVTHEEPHLKRFCERIIYMERGGISHVHTVEKPAEAPVAATLPIPITVGVS